MPSEQGFEVTLAFKRPRENVHMLSWAIFTTHSIARMMQRTIGNNDVREVRKRLAPFANAIVNDEIDPKYIRRGTSIDEVTLLSHDGAFIGTKEAGDRYVMKTWVDASQYHAGQREILKLLEPGNVILSFEGILVADSNG